MSNALPVYKMDTYWDSIIIHICSFKNNVSTLGSYSTVTKASGAEVYVRTGIRKNRMGTLEQRQYVGLGISEQSFRLVYTILKKYGVIIEF